MKNLDYSKEVHVGWSRDMVQTLGEAVNEIYF